MRTVTLSGWGQPHDALKEAAEGATHLDYAHAANVDEVFRMLAAQEPERVIGWSLGGQLAVRAIAAGAIAPKELVLIATPFQFKGSAEFEQNFAKNPARTLLKAWSLIHYEDTRSVYIADTLRAFDKDAVLKKDWLRWLRILMDFSCEGLDFSRFPKTILLHGDKDKVVDVAQSGLFLKQILHAKRMIWEGCGHAPHFHDATKLRTQIAEFADV